MDAINFAYWLQSQFELGDVKSFDEKKTQIIKQHALLVLKTAEINSSKKPAQYHAKPGMPPRPLDSKPIRC